MKRAFFIFFIPLLFLSCSNEKSGEFYESELNDKNLSLEKINEFVVQTATNSDHTIGKLRFTFATNRTGNLHAFYDEAKSQFVITDNDGTVKNVISKKGRGPGELIKAGSFNFDEENHLVVYDESQKMIKVFDSEGDVLKHSSLEETNYSIGGRKLYVNNGKIYAATMDNQLLGNLREQAYKSKLAAVYNYDGELVDTIGTYDPTVQQAKSYNLFSFINVDPQNNHLVSSHNHNYRVQIYDLATENRLAWFGRKTENYIEGEEYISPYQSRHEIREKSAGRSTGVRVYAMTDYIVLYFETLTNKFFETNNFNDKISYLVFYDHQTYDSYGEIVLSYILGNVAGEKFYLIEDDNPDNFTVGIYKLSD